MNEAPDNLDIDPSVEEHLNSVVNKMTEGSTPSKFFGDETVIPESSALLQGKAPETAHLRIQQEREESK